MIKLLDDVNCLAGFENTEPYWAAEVIADANVFISSPELMDIWVEYKDEKPSAVLKCDAENIALLTKSNSLSEDMLFFIGKLIEDKHFVNLSCRKEVKELLMNAFDLKSEEYPLMKCLKPREINVPKGLELRIDPPTDDIFKLLTSEDINGEIPPEKEFWELKIRRGMAKGFVTVAALYDGEKAVSCAMIRGRTKTSGAIASVLTRSDHRKMGCAGTLTAVCSNMLIEEGRTPWLIPIDDYAKKLYGKLGFLPAAVHYNLKIKEE